MQNPGYATELNPGQPQDTPRSDAIVLWLVWWARSS